MDDIFRTTIKVMLVSTILQAFMKKQKQA